MNHPTPLSKEDPAPQQGSLDAILHELQAEFFSDHMRVVKGKDTPAEMDANNADTLERTKTALLAWRDLYSKQREDAVIAIADKTCGRCQDTKVTPVRSVTGTVTFYCSNCDVSRVSTAHQPLSPEQKRKEQNV